MTITPESLVLVAILIVAVLFLGRFLVWLLGLLVVALVGVLLLAVFSDLTTGTHAVMGLLSLLYGAITALAVVIAAYLRGVGQQTAAKKEGKPYKA